MITTSNCLPPQIKSVFSAQLLSFPMPKFGDDTETIWNIYQFVKKKLWKKILKCPVMTARCIELEKQFLELYERAKIEEEKSASDKKTRNTPLGFYIKGLNQRDSRIYRSLKYKQ